MVQGIRWSGYVPPKLQADVTLSQDDPVSGDQYTILDTVQNCRVYQAQARVTWTVQPSPIELRIIIDGQTLVSFFNNPVSGTWYKWGSWQGSSADGWLIASNTGHQTDVYICEGRSVKIQAETTGGTVQNLAGRVKYALW